MPRFARFSVATPSRHPANQNGYDSSEHEHRYHADYVTPGSWVLNLSFVPEGLSEAPGGRFTLPREITSFGWTVKQGGGPFLVTVAGSRSPFRLTTDVRVPEPGDYEITLRVNLADGTREISTRNYRLRDLLIVGIGDSFASGQGNPDVPAIPAPDQEATCKATSLAIIVTNIRKFLTSLAKSAESDVRTAIGYLPFVGKIGLAGLTIADDIKGSIDGWVDDLNNKAVEIGRDVEATVVEGVEEVFGIFGLGDGGDPADTRPRRAAWQESHAYRSYRSGQSLAAREIERDSEFGADRVTFLSFARTGSEIMGGLLGPRTVDEVAGKKHVSIDGWTQNRGQVAEAKDTVLSRRIDALIITVGINDIGFSGLVERAILKASGEKRKERVQGAKNRVATEYPADLDRLKAAIDNELNPRHVFITEYPIGIFKEIAQGVPPCGVLGSVVPNPATGRDLEGLNLDQSDARDFGEVGVLLNEKIREKADEFGWVLIDGIERGFDGHGYCARKSFFVSAEESCLNQGDFEGMLHPDKSGHAVTRDCIAQALRRNLFAPEWLEPVLQVMMK
jgi:hypothetical protein